MSDIKCPNCGKTFNIDEADYASILNQVRDEAFEKAVKERSALFDQDKKTAIELAEAKLGLSTVSRTDFIRYGIS